MCVCVGGGGEEVAIQPEVPLETPSVPKGTVAGDFSGIRSADQLEDPGLRSPVLDGPTSRNQIQTCRRQLATYSRISKRTTFWNGVLFRRLQVRRTRHRDYSRHCRFLLYPQQLLMPQNQLRKLYQVGAFLTRLRGMRRGISSLIPELNP